MNTNIFTYSLLRYVHSASSGEALNGGLLFIFPEQKQVIFHAQIGSRDYRIPIKTSLSRIHSLSQVKKNERWLDNGLIDAETFFTPLIIKIIHGIILQEKELIFVIDSSVVGQGCQTLMLSVLWKKKAIPVVWKTIQAPKGHFPEADHLLLLKLLEGILKPLPNVRCVMLRDGEYDGSQWIQKLQDMKFEYVLRTEK